MSTGAVENILRQIDQLPQPALPERLRFMTRRMKTYPLPTVSPTWSAFTTR